MNYIHRTIENFVIKASNQFPVLLITGPRQVGKTSLLKHLATENRAYITLDDPLIAEFARKDPRIFLEKYKPPILIDEIQYAPELLPFIKMHVDNNRVPGQFWLTGSQQFQLMKNVGESLAGRIGIINLLGLSLHEQNGTTQSSLPFLPTQDRLEELSKNFSNISLMDLYYKIHRGSFPQAALNKDVDRDLFYNSYIQTYLQRDVRSLAKVNDELAFFTFLRAAAARTGQLLNLAELARDANISPTTAKSWLSILQASYIIYLLEPYHTNVTKRLIKAPKLYFLDTGLCTYLTEWPTPETLEAGAMSGAILETFVVAEIIKSYWHNGKRAPLYYYRDKDKKELDIIITQEQTLYPLEVKKTGSPTRKNADNFAVLDNLNMNVGPGGIICLIDRVMPLTEKINAIPVSLI